MIETYAMSHPLFPLAKHEAAHALHGFLVGHTIHGICVTRKSAHTEITYPMSAESLTSLFASNPRLWSCELARVLGTVMVGALAEGVALYGQDAESLDGWQRAYRRCGADVADWLKLKAASFAALTSWYRHSSVSAAVMTLGERLLREGEVSEYGFQSLLSALVVQHLPEPNYPVIPPSSTRWPHTSGAAAVRRSVAVHNTMSDIGEYEERARFFATLNAEQERNIQRYRAAR